MADRDRLIVVCSRTAHFLGGYPELITKDAIFTNAKVCFMSCHPTPCCASCSSSQLIGGLRAGVEVSAGDTKCGESVDQCRCGAQAHESIQCADWVTPRCLYCILI